MLLNFILFAASLPVSETFEQRFEYVAQRPLQSVSLAGSFNKWRKDATPMKLGPDGVTWSVRVKLSPGKHLYRFVLDGRDWIADPKAKRNVGDGSGNYKSVLILPPSDYAKPARAGDGNFARSAILHDRTIQGLKWESGKLKMILRTRPDDFSHLEMFAEDPAGEKCIELREVARDELYAYHQATLSWNRKQDVRYRFMLVDGPVRKYLTPEGLSEDARKPFVVSAKAFRAAIGGPKAKSRL